jgi:hypothetical protein
MQTAEVHISDSDFADRLKEMRVWLDAHRFEPSTFTYFFLCPGMRLRVSFDFDDEAIAFGKKFGGILLDAAIIRPAGSEDGREHRFGLRQTPLEEGLGRRSSLRPDT